MMKNLSIIRLLFLTLCLSACQPKQQTAAEQQRFICHTLIDSFLKTQSLNQYQLKQVEPASSVTANDQLYRYTAQQINRSTLMPYQATLKFNCQKLSARKFQIRLHHAESSTNGSAVLLRIELPEQQLKPLLTYADSLSKLMWLK